MMFPARIKKSRYDAYSNERGIKTKLGYSTLLRIILIVSSNRVYNEVS